MNIFQIIPNIVFVEDEEDYLFVEKLKQNKIVDNNNIKIINNNVNQYIVKPLDTISSVAKKLGINEQELIKKTNTTSLYVGQKIDL